MTPLPIQNVTASDLRVGQIRCGVQIKPYLPTAPATVEVLVKGRVATAAYTPRNDVDKYRSGVLRFGKVQLNSFLGGTPCTLSFDITAEGLPAVS